MVIDFVIEKEIVRSPTDVLAYVTDATKLATWQANTVSAVPEQPGPIGIGSRIREVHRVHQPSERGQPAPDGPGSTSSLR